MVILSGCTEDNAVTPETPDKYKIEIRDIPDSTGTWEGNIISIPFRVKVLDSENLPISGIRVNLSISDGPGTVDSAAVTNEYGIANAVYSVRISSGLSRVHIQASIDEVVSDKWFHLYCVGTPVKIHQPESIVATVRPGQSKPVSFQISVTDSSCKGVPGVNLSLVFESLSNPPVQGFFDTPAATDADGKTTVVYNNLGFVGAGIIRTSIVVNDSVLYAETYIGFITVANTIITLTAHPNPLFIPLDSVGTSYMRVFVTDEIGVGLPNIYEIDFTTNIGTMVGGRLFVRPSTDLDPPDEPATAIVTATITGTEISASVEVRIFPVIGIIDVIDLSANPDHFFLLPDSIGRSIITAFATDGNGNGIPNIVVNFRTNLGTLARPTITDGSGIATIEFFVRPSADLDPLDEPATATIIAAIPGTEISSSVEIRIFPCFSGSGFLSVEPDRRYIYADGPGLSQAIVTAVLQDEEGQAWVGEEIIFTVSFEHCTIQSPVITDSLGKAVSIFDDMGIPSIDPVIITAHYPPSNLHVSGGIWIREMP